MKSPCHQLETDALSEPSVVASTFCHQEPRVATSEAFDAAARRHVATTTKSPKRGLPIAPNMIFYQDNESTVPRR